MAITKAKRFIAKAANGNWQLARTKKQPQMRAAVPHKKKQSVQTRSSFSFPTTKLVHFREAKGKVIETLAFSAAPDHQDLSIRFQDKTGMNFSIQAGFTLKTEYSDWKSGEQRIIRIWPPFRS